MARRSTGDLADKEALDVLGAKRDRGWEAEQRKRGIVATYRGIPPELQDRIKAVASELGVNIGDVARRFLEYALAAYDAGEIDLRASIVSIKRTLYPDE